MYNCVLSRGADVGGLLSEPTNPATTWTLFCTLPMPTLRSSLASSSPLVSLTTISVFVLSIVVSIKVLLTSTSLIYSSSPIITSLSAIAFTKSMYLLMPECLAARSGVTSLILDFIQQLWQACGVPAVGVRAVDCWQQCSDTKIFGSQYFFRSNFFLDPWLNQTCF